MKRNRYVYLVLAMMLVLIGSGCAKTEDKAPEETSTVSGAVSIAVPAATLTFEAKDLSGNTVTEVVFTDKTLTLVNIWGTYCGPCLDEMPELNKLCDTLAQQNMGLIGVVIDGDQAPLARRIQREQSLKYINVLPDAAFMEFLNKKVDAVPTSWLVDEKGKIVAETVGSQTAEDYLGWIEGVMADR